MCSFRMEFEIDFQTFITKFKDYLMNSESEAILLYRIYPKLLVEFWFSYQNFTFHIKIDIQHMKQLYNLQSDEEVWNMFVDEFINNNSRAIKVL